MMIKLCDDTKKLESELTKLTAQCLEQTNTLDQLRNQLELLNKAKDEAEQNERRYKTQVEFSVWTSDWSDMYTCSKK